MKKMFCVLCLSVTAQAALAQDFSKVTEDMPKAEIISILGNPSKVITSDDQTTQCYLWLKKDTAWFVYIKDNKAMGPASSIEETLKGIMDISSMFSSIGQNETETPDEAVLDEKSETLSQRERAAIAKIEIQILDAKIIETWDKERKAGCKFKIRNNSSETIYNLDLTIYYYNKNGKIFFEQTTYPVNSSSWTDKTVLKPNYSILYPSDAREYITASGMDISEWDEGKVKIEIAEIRIEKKE